MGWVGLVWGVGAPPPYAFSCSPPGAPFLHIAQNKEDRHHCFCEGDPGRGLIGGRALDPTLALQHPSARAVLAHTHKLLPHWPWAFQEESKGLLPSAKEAACRGPRQAHLGPTSASAMLLQGPQVSIPGGPGLGGARMPLPDAAAPHREGSWCLCTGHCLGPALDATQVVYFFISQLNGLCTL